MPRADSRQFQGEPGLRLVLRIKQRDSLGIAVLLDGESRVDKFLSGVGPLGGFGAIDGKHQKKSKPPIAVLVNLVIAVLILQKRAGNVGIAAFILPGSGVVSVCKLLDSQSNPPKTGLSEIKGAKSVVHGRGVGRGLQRVIAPF